MSKVTAPALSFGARGQIAKTMVYSKWRSVNYVRQHVIPANPQSAAQTLTRSVFAFMREIWKRLGADARAPWDAFAAGRSFLGLNKQVGENVRVLRTESDLTDIITSPGAGGGLGLQAFGAVSGSGSGEIDATITEPVLPSGWSITKAVFMAIPDQDPHGVFSGVITMEEDLATPFAATFTGLTPAADYAVSGWLVYEKPDGSVAYSPSANLLATALA